MSRKVAIVTGANSGIGYHTTLGLAKKGYHVILICRNSKKGEEAMKSIKESSVHSSLELIIADLSDFKSVTSAIRNILKNHQCIDLIVCNAGFGYLGELTMTKNKNELTFQVKYLSHVLLSLCLLNRLQKSKDGRIVVVSGSFHNQPIQMDDLNFEKNYSPMNVSPHTCLAQIMFTYTLSRILKRRNIDNVKVVTLHPGAVNTNIQNTLPWYFKMFYYVCSPFFHDAKSGAEPVIFLSTNQEIECGEYYDRMKKARSAEISYDLKVQKQLWIKTLQILKIREDVIFGEMKNSEEEEEIEGEDDV